MKKNTDGISKPSKTYQFLWKYLDIHKFISFLVNRELFFTRLDKFEDPIEGIRTSLLRELNSSDKQLDLDAPKIREMQTRNYVNCWFAGDRESMAMWNLYSNADSVVIKVDFELLKKEIEKSFKNNLRTTPDLKIFGKSVTYLDLNPFDSNLPLQKISNSAFKKDRCFEYEKEYRFLIKTSSAIPEEFHKIPINFEKLKLKVLAHPKIEEELWKFENLKGLIDLANRQLDTKIEIDRSQIKLR